MGKPERESLRVKVEYGGFVVVPATSRMIRLSTLDVSLGGLKASLEEPVSFGCRMMLNLVVGDYHVANLIVHPVWANEDVFGFQIEEAPSEWPELIGRLTPAAEEA